jgi:hypothetical protein
VPFLATSDHNSGRACFRATTPKENEMKTKNWTTLIILSIVLVFLNGCGDKKEEAAQQTTTEAVKEQVQEATDKAGEMAEEATEKTTEMAKEATDAVKEGTAAAMDWSQEKIDAFMSEAKTQLGDFDAKFEELSAKAAEMDDAAKEALSGQMEELATLKDAAAEKLASLQDASGDAWAAAKAEYDELIEQIKTLYENIKESMMG